MSTLEVSYISYATFALPKGVVLLKPSENKAAKEGTPFTWWIKWKTLHYYDAKGVEQEIEGDDCSEGFKWHSVGSEHYTIDEDETAEQDWLGDD